MNKLKYLIFPAIIYTTCLSIIFTHDLLSTVLREWPIAVTMFFGSFIAGSTAEGGAAVAFPVMTLILKIPPAIARDFGLSIQSIGMVSASIFIFLNKIPIIKSILVKSLVGSFVGLHLGFGYLDKLIAPDQLKFLFTGIWQSFSLALLFIHSKNNEENNDDHINGNEFYILGLLGGIISSLVGSGIDILIFTYLSLRYKVSAKVATPTSVVIMSVTTLMGAFFKHTLYGGLNPAIFPMLLIAGMVVVFGAPLGAWTIKYVSNKIVLLFLVTSITLQSIWALIILPLNFKNLMTFILSLAFGTMASFYLNRPKIKHSL